MPDNVIYVEANDRLSSLVEQVINHEALDVVVRSADQYPLITKESKIIDLSIVVLDDDIFSVCKRLCYLASEYPDYIFKTTFNGVPLRAKAGYTGDQLVFYYRGWLDRDAMGK